MILASGEGQLVLLLIMAVIGVINWISGKLKDGGSATPPGPSAPGAGSTSPRRANSESEEERMRRFLEALGVPTGEGSTAPRPTTRPQAEQRPVPPIVAPPPIPASPRRPKRPVATPAPLEPQWHPTSLDELPAPVARVERISIPELKPPVVPEFETITSKISAVPTEFPGAHDETERPHGPNLGETLRLALASPQQLRSAFILSEVFGPPPGLR
ncbi:MAG: hypothetical protein WCF18_17600 [Chthoniobacteraceae bacterium]